MYENPKQQVPELIIQGIRGIHVAAVAVEAIVPRPVSCSDSEKPIAQLPLPLLLA